ncbi:MAG: prenyltransferase, partial [Chloroflexota bacterium]
IEFPEAEGDRQAGKCTLVVRLGASSAARLYVSLILLAIGVLPVLVLAGLPRLIALAVAATLPLVIWQIRRILRGDWHDVQRWNRLGFYSLVLLVATSAAELVAFVLLIGDAKLLG